MRKIVLIAHDMRSCHNVGSLLRTAEGLGMEKVFLTGYTPYPLDKNDPRLPHLAEKLTKQISKTALGAETTQAWQYSENVRTVIDRLKQQGYTIVGLEQTSGSQPLHVFSVPEKLAIVLGREVEGIAPEILTECDASVEIPMFGQKESFNVVQAAAMTLHYCRFFPYS